MLNFFKTIFIIFIFINAKTAFAQGGNQTLKGIVLDKQSETPLIGATVKITDIVPIMGASTDENGNFSIKNVPTGRHQLQISYIGYNTSTLSNIVVTAGKETVLNLILEETVSQLNEVVVSGKIDKSQTINELATISARQFNVEEVQRYSGGRNDVSRMVANFAGVATNNDSRNDIVIRGNSPTGVLWRLEGVPIPSPNHFSTLGTTGGPVSALNPNMIRNSDFLTSAFPAEYGNATAGVFDIGFRKGNQEKYEVTAQMAAFTGFEGMIEGPILKKKGSFVVAYRHSFVEVAHLAGLNIGTKSVPRYKDLSFNIDFGQSKFGSFSLFGIGGLSSVDFLAKDNGEADFFSAKKFDSYARSKLGIVGLRHNYLINNTSYIRTIISTSYASVTYNSYQLLDNGEQKHITDVSDITKSNRITSFYNKKFDAKWSLRTGVVLQNMNLNSDTRSREFFPDWTQYRLFKGGINLFEAFAQTQYKPTERITLNGGLHAQYLQINGKSAIEPRFAVNYRLRPNQTLSLGYGLHNQMQPLPVFFFQEILSDGTVSKTNRDLDFTRSNHFVLGYDLKAGSDWHAKVELYYQLLDRVPVEKLASSFSLLNAGADFAFPQIGRLENKGTGDNYGTEITIEKYFSRGWYMLTTTSIFQSKYKGSDGIERNTAFNSQYIFNTLLGKEFKFGKNKQNAFTLDTKLTTAGGRFYTPVNEAASKFFNLEIYDNERAFSEQQTPYFRWDIKVGYTLNSTKRKFTQQFYLDFQNITNHKNIFQQRYSLERSQKYYVYQIGFLPDVLYRVQF